MVPIKLNGNRVYGYPVADGGGARVRVSADEWERLGLTLGQQVRVEIPGRTADLLLAAADEAPPFVWLRLRPLASRVAG